MALGITKGDWESSEVHSQIITTEDTNICQVFKHDTEEGKSNIRLIADAGTTANKCGLLPSEILEQNQKLREALIGMLPNYNAYVPLNEETGKPYTNALKALDETLNK